jgi:serine/threonine protein kinase
VTEAKPPPKVPGLTGLTVLARGGYATVYKAEQESVGRDVAVKVENRTIENDRDQRRFLREARAAGRMSSHPHVVDLFDAGVTEDGHPFLVMELCDGNYAERMRTSPLTAPEVREVGFKIADALADGHALGVLHRDVKPANILYSRFGEPALADFGLAILAEWRDVSITLDVLTPAYAPPEMFRQSEPSPAGDVYSLCATLYALMRGRPPRWREGQPPSMVSLVDLFSEPIPDLPGVPVDLMRILRAGMANDENHRPTAMELRDALTALRTEPPGVLIPPLGSPSVPTWASTEDEDTVRHGQPALPFVSAMPFGTHGLPGPVQPTTPPPAPVSPAAPVVPSLPPAPRPSTIHGGQTSKSFLDKAFSGRHALWWAVGVGALVVAALVAAVLVTKPNSGRGTTFHTPVAGASPSATQAPSVNGSGDQACPPPAPDGLTCVRTPACYDVFKKKIDCKGKHTWEEFAYGELPTGVKPADAPKNQDVRRACSFVTLVAVDANTALAQWDIEVLVPTGSSRTYRCIAGRGPNALTGPQIGK